MGTPISQNATGQIDGTTSVFEGAGIDKQIKHRDGVATMHANSRSGTAIISFDEPRFETDDINTLVADCVYRNRRKVLNMNSMKEMQ